jgi:hypothetical protein
MRLDARRTAGLLAELQTTEWRRERWIVPIDQLWHMQRRSQEAVWRVIHKLKARPPSQARV